MKRLLALLLIIAVVGTLLGGCGTSGTNTKEQSAAAEKAENKESATVEKQEEKKETKADPASFKGSIEITAPQGDYVKFLEESVKPLFKKEYPNLEVVVTPEGQFDRFLARVAANDLPGIYISPMGGTVAMFQSTGKLVNIKELPGAQEELAKVDSVFITQIQDGVYNIPWNATTQMMIWNKDLFKQAGLDPEKPPETFDEFLQYAETIDKLPKTKDGNEVYGTYFWNQALSWGGWYWGMMAQIYYNFNDGKYQLLNATGTDIVFDKPEAKFKEFLDFMVKAQKFAPKNSDGNDFFTRRVGMWLQFGYGWKNNLRTAKDKPMVVGEDVGIAPIPVPVKGQKHWSTLDGRNLLIFKKDDNSIKNSWELVKFLMRDNVNLAACRDIGQLPTLLSLKDDPFFQKPGERVFVEQAKTTLLGETFNVSDSIQNAFLAIYTQCVVEGKISTDEAIKQFAEKARRIIKESQQK